MNNLIVPVPAIDCVALFQAERLPELPLPASLLAAMRSQGGHRFASVGWTGGATLQEAAVRWLQAGGSQSAGWCAVVQGGVHSTRAEVAFVSPRCGFFVGKLMSEALADRAIHRRKLAGAFKLMKRLIDSVESASDWPAGQRLVVFDRDGQALRWGWVADTHASWADLTPDSMAWVAALISVVSGRGR